MKKLSLLIFLIVFAICNCYSQDYLGKTMSQVKESMRRKHPNVKIEVVTHTTGKTLYQLFPDKNHFVYFNKNGICNLEKVYPLDNVTTTRFLLAIKKLAYTDFYNRENDIHSYKIRVEGKGIIQVDFVVDHKGYYVFELFLLNKYGKRNLF